MAEDVLAAWQRCRDALPDVAVTAPELAAYLAARRGPDQTLAEQVQPGWLPDLLLACGCLAGEPNAIARFERDVLPAADPALAQWTPAVADETRQRLRAMILVDHDGRGPLLATYTGRGPLRRWVRVIAGREASKARRDDAELVPVDDGALFDALAPAADAAVRVIASEATAAFKTAFAAALRALDRRDRTLLRMHVLDGLTLDELAPLHGAHRATIARWIAAAKATVLRGTRKQLMRELVITASEVESLIRVIDSRLELGDHLLASSR